MKERIEFKKVRDFSDLISDTVLFIRQNFKPLMKAIFCFCGFFMVGGVITLLLQKMDAPEILPEYTINNRLYVLMATWQYWMLLLFSILNYTSMYVTVLSYIALYIEKGNQPPNLDEVWSYFKFYFFRVMGSGIIMTMFVGICTLFCVLPGVYVFPAFCLFFSVMVMENASFGYSFGRSFKLLDNEWWITFAVILIIYIITMLGSFIVQIPAGILMMVETVGNLQGKPMNSFYIIIQGVLYNLARVFMVLPIVCFALTYFNLVERKENTGLLNRIEGLGQHKPTPPAESIPEEY